MKQSRRRYCTDFHVRADGCEVDLTVAVGDERQAHHQQRQVHAQRSHCEEGFFKYVHFLITPRTSAED